MKGIKNAENLREYALKTTNQGAYDRCNVPRSAEEAGADLDGFARAVHLLRMEYRIPELVLGASVPVEGEERDLAATVILGNRAHAAPRLAATLLHHADEMARVLLEEAESEPKTGFDWASAWSAVCVLRAALEGVDGAPSTASLKSVVEEAKDLRAAQDAAADLEAALRADNIWTDRVRGAMRALVHALGGETLDE